MNNRVTEGERRRREREKGGGKEERLEKWRN